MRGSEAERIRLRTEVKNSNKIKHDCVIEKKRRKNSKIKNRIEG